jgi:hypothetical protein
MYADNVTYLPARLCVVNGVIRSTLLLTDPPLVLR